MLDVFIIEKIRQETELRESERIPLRIEIPRRPEHDVEEVTQNENSDRDIAIVDFNIMA